MKYSSVTVTSDKYAIHSKGIPSLHICLVILKVRKINLPPSL